MKFRSMKYGVFAVIWFSGLHSGLSQSFDVEAERNDTEYIHLKETVLHLFDLSKSTSAYVSDQILLTDVPKIILTFDACDGQATAYDSALIEYLHEENVPATFFVSGVWIDRNASTFKKLANDSLFEIENHGLYHKPCSVNHGSSSVGTSQALEKVIDEIELNARKIESATHDKPLFYRSVSDIGNTNCGKVASLLNETMIAYDVDAGDDHPNSTVNIIRENVLSQLKNGPIILMHTSHAEWNTLNALKIIIPILKKQHYIFVKLIDYECYGR